MSGCALFLHLVRRVEHRQRVRRLLFQALRWLYFATFIHRLSAPYSRWYECASPEGWYVALPTDAEWEYTAQYDDERTYPWGNGAADPTLANYGSTIGWTTASETYPGGPDIGGELIYDMGGNVWEWCNDWYTCSLGTTPETDPTGPGRASPVRRSRCRRARPWRISGRL